MRTWTLLSSSLGEYIYRQDKMRLLIYLLIFGVLPVFVSGFACDDQTLPENAPCTVHTPILLHDCGGEFVYNVTRLSDNVTVLANETMEAVGDGTYQFDLNETAGDYSVVICDGSVATVTIAYDGGQDLIWLYIVAFGVLAVLVWAGLFLGDWVFVMLAGFGTAALSIVMFMIDFPAFSNVAETWVGVVALGLAFYLIGWSGIELLRGL